MYLSLSVLHKEMRAAGLPSEIFGDASRKIKGVRVLTEGNRYLEPDILYVADRPVPEKWFLQGVFLTKKGGLGENRNFNGMLITDASASLPDVFNNILEILSRYSEMESSLLELLSGESSWQGLVNLLSKFYGNPAYIMDSSYKLLALNDDPELPYISLTFKRLKEQGYMPLNTIMSLLKSVEWQSSDPEGKTAYMMIPQFYCPFLRSEYRVENVLQAYLFVIGIHNKILEGDQELLDVWNPYIRRFFEKHLKSVAFSGVYHEHFFHDVFSGSLADDQRIQEQLQPIGWNKDDLFSILHIPAGQITSDSLRGVLFQRLNHMKDSRPFYNNQDLYCVFRLEKPADKEQQKKDLTLFLSQINIKGGLSEPFRGFKRMALFSEQAVHAQEVGEHIDPGNHLFPYESYVLPYLFRRIAEMPESSSFIHESVPFLERYDQEHKTDYLQTLRQFLKNDCSLVGTANALYIHRNTLVYRIRQIRELTGLDLDQWTVRFRLLLSIELFSVKKEYISRKSNY